MHMPVRTCDTFDGRNRRLSFTIARQRHNCFIICCRCQTTRHAQTFSLSPTHQQSQEQTMSATSDLPVASPPPKRSVEMLDSTSEIGILFEKHFKKHLAHSAKAEIDARFAALVAFFEIRKRNKKGKQLVIVGSPTATSGRRQRLSTPSAPRIKATQRSSNCQQSS